MRVLTTKHRDSTKEDGDLGPESAAQVPGPPGNIYGKLYDFTQWAVCYIGNGNKIPV